MSSFDADGYQGQYEGEFPEWAHELAVPYRAYDLVRRDADRQLGTRDVAGEIGKRFGALQRQSFYDCIATVRDDLPDAIRCKTGSNRQLVINTNIGTNVVSANRSTAYFLPKTDELLVFGEYAIGDIGKHGDELFPDDPNFIGMDSLRKNPPLDVNFHKLTHNPNQAFGELDAQEMDIVVRTAQDTLKDSPKLETVTQHKQRAEQLEKELLNETAQAEEDFGGRIRQRVINLVGVIAQNPRLYNRLPKIVKAGVRFESRAGNKGIQKSSLQPFFVLKDRRLVLAPVLKSKNWLDSIRLGFAVEDEKPDLPNATEAGNKEWVNTRSLVSDLMRPIDAETRAFIEQPVLYEKNRADDTVNKDTPPEE